MLSYDELSYIWEKSSLNYSPCDICDWGSTYAYREVNVLDHNAARQVANEIARRIQEKKDKTEL